MTDKQIDKHIPRLRFPEFQNEGAWNESLFGDLFMFLPNNTLSRADLKEGAGNVYNVHYGDVLIKLNAYTDIQSEKLPAIKNVADISKYQNARLQNGDIVIADTAEDETVGKCTEIGNTQETVVVSGLHTIPCRPKMKFAQAFLGYYINSNSFHNKLRPIMQGVKVTSISKSALQNIYLTFPKSLEEQQKLASCLSSIDSYISSINEKIEQLKAHKKSLMQKLFPQNGRTVPEYRFPEFEKDEGWTEKKLGEYLVEHKLKSDGQCEVYSVSVSKGVVNQIDYLGRSFSASDTSKYKLVKPFDVIYTKSPTGSFPYGIIKQSFIDHNVIVSPLYGVFSPLNKYIGYIIHSYFESPERTNNYLAPVVKKGAKNTIQISNDTFLSQTVCFPSDPKEQRKIAECLYSITKITDLFYSMMELLRSQKKGLMQLLFPSSK